MTEGDGTDGTDAGGPQRAACERECGRPCGRPGAHLRSAAEARPTPPMTGSKQMLTCQGRRSFMKTAPNSTLKRGSSDLTTLTKASEPAPSDMTVTHWPAPWMMDTGRMVFAWQARAFSGSDHQHKTGRGATTRVLDDATHGWPCRRARALSAAECTHIFHCDLRHLPYACQPKRGYPQDQADAKLQGRDRPGQVEVLEHRLVVVIVHHVDHIPD